MALKKPVATAAVEEVNFGSLDMYGGGYGIPDGKYVWSDVTPMMYQAQNNQGVNQGPARLGVMITMLPLEDPKEENKKTQFYSMGTKADQSYRPNPNTGKGLIAVPNAPSTILNDSTNWSMLLKSLYDCGMPQGYFTNNTTVLEGIHVNMHNEKEPDSRKNIQSATSEVQEVRKDRTIAIVTEVLDGGAPWEGGGGIPAVTAAAAPAPAKPVAVPKALPKPVAVAAPAAQTTADDDTVRTAAESAISEKLEKAAAGCPKLALKTSVVASVKAAYDQDTVNAVVETYFADGTEEALNGILGELGYVLNGGKVVPVA